MNENTVVCFRGYTHAVFNLLQSSSVAASVGRYVREHLVEKEYVPEHMEQSKGGGWYRVHGQWKQKYMYARYDQKSQKLFVPIAFCEDICNVIREWGANVEIRQLNDYTPGKISVQMKPEFHDMDHQIELIEKCSDPHPGMKGLAMQTGKGKTYSAIKSWVNLGYRGLIIVKGLMDQWIKSIVDFTDVDKDNVYKIQEFSTLAALAQHPEYKPDVFVASLKTLQLFADGSNDYDVLPWNYTQFLQQYGIGVKVVDECHQCFHATTMMDLRSNVQHNLYCSATFTQSNKQARQIFNRVFPERIQYGLSAYDKYVTTYFYGFSGEVPEKKCTRSRGYNHVKYEAEIMKSERRFNTHLEEMIYPLIRSHFLGEYQKGDRLLIVCSSIEFVTKVAESITKEFQDFVVKSYLGGDNMSVLDDAEIIVSTTGKSGTGLDIKRLTCVINTVSMQSETLIPQLFGRLRKFPGRNVYYIDRWDTNISAQCRHADERKSILRRLSLKYYEYQSMYDLHTSKSENTGSWMV